jgi:hypothetical protein
MKGINIVIVGFGNVCVKMLITRKAYSRFPYMAKKNRHIFAACFLKFAYTF